MERLNSRSSREQADAVKDNELTDVAATERHWSYIFLHFLDIVCNRIRDGGASVDHTSNLITFLCLRMNGRHWNDLSDFTEVYDNNAWGCRKDKHVICFV
nr:hypothetical protein [Tanacetum cinerariifolium]